MRGIPDSIDELMWLVAEQNDASASESFTRRYPEFRDELMRRTRVVRDLKAAKANCNSPIPEFRYRPVSVPVRPRLAWGVAFAFALAAIGYGSYRVTKNFAAAAPPAQVEAASSKPKLNEPFTTDKTKGINWGPAVKNSGNPMARNGENPVVEPPTPMTSLVSIHEKKATLLQVVDQISRQTGLSIQLAPGMPNPTLTADFEGSEPMAILRRLGEEFEFTAFEQDSNSLLLIPAVDSGGNTTQNGKDLPSPSRPE